MRSGMPTGCGSNCSRGCARNGSSRRRTGGPAGWWPRPFALRSWPGSPRSPRGWTPRPWAGCWRWWAGARTPREKRPVMSPAIPGSLLALIESMPGNLSLESMLTEIRKLQAARGVSLPARLFADVAPKVLAGWRARCAVESPSHLRRRSPDSAATLLAALGHERLREITDDLTELLIATVHRLDARWRKEVDG